MIKTALHDDIDVTEEYTGHSDEIDDVQSFLAPESLKVIQIISTKRNPLGAVLKFHSCA